MGRTDLQGKIQSAVKWLEKFTDRIWYPPLIAILSALDNLVIVIPNDGILITSCMLIPKRWALYATSIAIGSTLGAIGLALLVEYQGLPWILKFFPGIDNTDMWIWTDQFFTEYGLLLVFAIGASPLIQQPAVILAAIANVPLLQLTLAIFLGRYIKYLLMAYVASHFPKLLKNMWGLKKELKDAGVKID